MDAAALLEAPAHWRCIDFASDIHLHASMPRTFAAFCRWLEGSDADALFILGDLFEVWVGDDALDADPFAQACANALQRAARRRPLHLMHGNRDFLMGARLALHTGARMLSDPSVMAYAGRRWLLTHGDSLCTDDAAYVAFRSQVRGHAWQQRFLAQPLADRERLAASMREQSQTHQAMRNTASDVNAAQVDTWLEQADASVMIHGHTHRPADHRLGQGRIRFVLSDWDCDGHGESDDQNSRKHATSSSPALQARRAQVLRLTPQGIERVSLV